MINSVTLDFKVSNCQYRCAHCDGSKSDPCSPISLEKIQNTVDSFLRHKGSIYENLFVFISNSAFLYNDFPELVDFLNSHGVRYAKEPINGVRFDDAFFKTQFPGIASSSLDTVRVTLFGLEPTHDRFAGFKNSFHELMAFARAFIKHQKLVVFHLYITPENIGEIDALQQQIEDAFPESVITHEYSNCYKDNYRRRKQFLLPRSCKEKAQKWNLSLVTEEELAESCKGKKPLVWHNNLWIRTFGNGDCNAAIFPLGSFYGVGNMNTKTPEALIAQSVETMKHIEETLPTYDCLIDEVHDPNDPFLYAPDDALGLWWSRYSRKHEITSCNPLV